MSMITCVSCLNSTICLIFWWSTTRNLVHSTNVCNHRIVNPKGLVLILWIAFRDQFARCWTGLVSFGCESLVVCSVSVGDHVRTQGACCELFSFSIAFLHSDKESRVCVPVFMPMHSDCHVPSLQPFNNSISWKYHPLLS